jgi:hypothetical protein
MDMDFIVLDAARAGPGHVSSNGCQDQRLALGGSQVLTAIIVYYEAFAASRLGQSRLAAALCS